MEDKRDRILISMMLELGLYMHQVHSLPWSCVYLYRLPM